MDFLNYELISTIVAILTTVLSSVFGPKYNKYKKIVKMFVAAMEDDNLSKKELKAIAKTLKEM